MIAWVPIDLFLCIFIGVDGIVVAVGPIYYFVLFEIGIFDLDGFVSFIVGVFEGESRPFV